MSGGVYLAGPINDVQDPYTWRDVVSKEIDCDVLNPLDIEDYAGTEDVPQSVVDADIEALTDAEIVLCRRVKGTETWGTPMELRIAYNRGIRVVTINEHSDTLSPWLRYHSDTIVGSVGRAVEVLE